MSTGNVIVTIPGNHGSITTDSATLTFSTQFMQPSTAANRPPTPQPAEARNSRRRRSDLQIDTNVANFPDHAFSHHHNGLLTPPPTPAPPAPVLSAFPALPGHYDWPSAGLGASKWASNSSTSSDKRCSYFGCGLGDSYPRASRTSGESYKRAGQNLGESYLRGGHSSVDVYPRSRCDSGFCEGTYTAGGLGPKPMEGVEYQFPFRGRREKSEL